MKSMKASRVKASAAQANFAKEIKTAQTEKFAAMTNKFNAFSTGVNAKPEEISKAFLKDEQITFDVKTMEEGQKLIDNFQDKSVKYTPEAIMASVKEFYGHMKGNTELFKNVKAQLLAASIAIAMGPQAAFAADGKIMPEGMVSYSQFLSGVNEHVIERVRVGADGRSAEFLNVDGGRGVVNLFNDPSLFKILQDNQVDLSVMPPDATGNFLFGILNTLAFPLLFFGGLFLLNRARGGEGGMPGGPNNPMNMGKSKAKVQLEPDTGVTFDQVAGVDEAKFELAEIVDFLKEPSQYTKLGAKIPRGALLIGPPGTGKTLLAKAVAGEAGVPFISISAAEFIEMFVGVGASRVRDLFAEAKKNAPCIVFIDELDAVGRQRAQGIGMGNDERE